MKIRNFSVVWLFLYFFSSAVFAETITIVTLSPTGVATQDVLTKAVGESINVVVKPKVGFKGVVKVDGGVVATGEVNHVLRYKISVVGDSRVETSYLSDVSNFKTLTGVFLDSNVGGISYKTSSGKTGVTTAKGEFQYKANDRVSFSVGDINLGETDAKNTVTVFDLDNSVQVAQFLQTFDEDNIPSNGINITQKTSNAMTSSSNTSVTESINISEFNAESSKSNQFVKDVVKIAELSEREIVSNHNTINHAVYALSEQGLPI